MLNLGVQRDTSFAEIAPSRVFRIRVVRLLEITFAILINDLACDAYNIATKFDYNNFSSLVFAWFITRAYLFYSS